MPLLNCGSYKTVQVMSALQIELFFDEEAGNWHYRVPALHIQRRRHPPALEGDSRDFDADAETVTFDVTVAPAA